MEQGQAVFETYVEREDGGSARMHGSETQGDWRDYIEKAQTKSLGRALATVGYGSQFTDDEFNEGERIVDSPVNSTNGHKSAKAVETTIEHLQALCDEVLGPNKWGALRGRVLDPEEIGDVPDDMLSIAQKARIHGALVAHQRQKANKTAASVSGK